MTPGLPSSESPLVHVAPMRRRHLRAVMAIDAQVYPRPWSLSLYRGELSMSEHRRLYVVGRVDRDLVGHAGMIFAADEAHVTTVAVDPARQRQGIGVRLLLVMFRAAVTRGATALTLEVRTANVAAQELYRRFGFVDAGIRKGYYPETNEDALIMWAHGVDSADYLALLDRVEQSLVGPPPVDQVTVPGLAAAGSDCR